ncbi:MAG: MASE1 domain-containing protein, partial [Candidatus Krumholzibacteria bacterium]|nr:MASE1 domain-containing protein [Candidatus Krumholzibacteria bacterium]
LVFVVGFLLFGNTPFATGDRLALAYLVIPVLIWPAFRFTQRETAIALFLVSAIAYWGTVNGYAPFGNEYAARGILLFRVLWGLPR